ncbi:MAG: acyl carrier protein [Aestuariivirga sp.]|jgi:acyl carrier protein
MTSKTEIIEAICKLLEPFNAEHKALSATTDIPAELNIDSVGVLDFIMEVEDHFDIEIPMNVVSEIRTIGELADYVEGKVVKS